MNNFMICLRADMSTPRVCGGTAARKHGSTGGARRELPPNKVIQILFQFFPGLRNPGWGNPKPFRRTGITRKLISFILEGRPAKKD